MGVFLALVALPSHINRNRLDLGEVKNRIACLHVIACGHVIDLVGNDEFSKFLGRYPIDKLFGFSVVFTAFDDAGSFNAEARAVFRICLLYTSDAADE